MIFLDTSFLYPLFNTQDEDHLRVRAVFEGYRGRQLSDVVVTTPQIIFETITLIRFGKGASRPDARTRHRQAVHAGERLLCGKLAQIYQPGLDDERAAFEYFKRFDDKEYSAVDCLSFVIMEKLGMREALAVDEDFTHRFIAHPGPRPRP